MSDDRPLHLDDDDPAWWPDERLAARRDELLRRQMGWLAAGSAFYQRVFATASVDPQRIRGTNDLPLLPVTTKADLMADPAAFRLRLPDANLYDVTYATVYTTGTTAGRPTPYEYTAHDFLGVLLSGRRLYRHLGLRPGDRFLSLFPISPLPHVAGFASAIANAAGLSFSHGMAGMPYPEFPVHRSSRDLLAQLRESRPAGVAGIGSFIRRMLVEAADDDADLSSIRVVIASGEVLTARMRDHMRDHLAACGAKDVFIASTYAFTEGGVAWTPSTEDGPLYATAPDQIFLEILDSETHERLPDGEPGLVAVTHLNRRGMPLVRYLLGDIAALTHEPDPHSGRRGQGLLVASGSAHVTRTTDLLKIKGTLVNPQLIHDVVMNTAGVVEYQMVVTNAVEGDRLTPERLVLRLGLDRDAEADGDSWLQTVGAQLCQAVRGAAEITPALELVAQSEIYDPVREFKARRLVDRRPAE